MGRVCDCFILYDLNLDSCGLKDHVLVAEIQSTFVNAYSWLLRFSLGQGFTMAFSDTSILNL